MKVAVIWANALLSVVIFGATAYAVFMLDRSAWWFLAAVVIDAVMSQRVKTSTAGDLSLTEAGR